MIAVGAAISLVVLAIVTLTAGPSKVRVPFVTGMSEATAVSDLHHAGLKVTVLNVDERLSVPNSIADGTVVAQSPIGRTQVSHGSVVTISVLRGGPVPAVTGVALTVAEHRLSQWGFRYRVTGTSAFTTSDTPVVSQSPRANTNEPTGVVVTLALNPSPFPRTFRAFAWNIHSAPVGPWLAFGTAAPTDVSGDRICGNVATPTSGVAWTLWCRGPGEYPALSEDGGATWTTAGPLLASDWAGGSMYEVSRVTACSPSVVALAGEFDVDVTTDGGHQWYLFPNGPSEDWTMTVIGCNGDANGTPYVLELRVVATTPGYAGTATYVTQNGRSWTRLSQQP